MQRMDKMLTFFIKMLKTYLFVLSNKGSFLYPGNKMLKALLSITKYIVQREWIDI